MAVAVAKVKKVMFYFVLSVVYTNFAGETKPITTMNDYDRSNYHLPAEWSPQSGVMLVWPNANTDWAPYLADIEKTYVELAKAITRYEDLLIVTADRSHVADMLRPVLTKEQVARVVCRVCNFDDTWARDYGPITITQRRSGCSPIQNRLLNFRFNGWGDKFAASKDNAVTERLYHSGVFYGALDDQTDFVFEGGALENDGHGTLFVTRSSQLSEHRNQPMTQDDIERRLHSAFGCVRRVVWIEHGQLVGDDTDGHIDTLVRCAPNYTLLYVGADEGDEQYDELHAMERQLQSLRTLDGKAYRLMRLPLPDAIYDGGDRLPATYANFLIINGAVIVPTYGQPEHDRYAMNVIQSAFPDREVIGIDSRTAIRQHGSLHCLTMNLPAGVLIKDGGTMFV